MPSNQSSARNRSASNNDSSNDNVIGCCVVFVNSGINASPNDLPDVSLLNNNNNNTNNYNNNNNNYNNNYNNNNGGNYGLSNVNNNMRCCGSLFFAPCNDR